MFTETQEMVQGFFLAVILTGFAYLIARIIGVYFIRFWIAAFDRLNGWESIFVVATQALLALMFMRLSEDYSSRTIICLMSSAVFLPFAILFGLTNSCWRTRG